MANALNTITNGTQSSASELNQNFERSYFQGGLQSSASYGNVTVGSSSTQIKASTSTRLSILIRNNSNEALYVGASGVTTSTGKEVAVGKSIYIQDTEAIYGVTASGSADIRYIEVTTS